jgi:delta1-piperideine-2-carboxylate reductase
MSQTQAMSLDEIYQLAFDILLSAGADEHNATILASVLVNAERDGSHSHGLFRLPAYVVGLKSKKINGGARAEVTQVTSSFIRVDGNQGLAPTAHDAAIPALAKAAQKTGVAIAAIHRCFHMAALWPEVEAIAEYGLAGIACTNYMPSVAPAGANKAFFGTNPIAFAWPRPGKTPIVYDMATAAMALGEVQVAARDGKKVALGTGLDKEGQPTTDPAAISKGGVLLPFGGYKGSGMSMMVELLTAGLTGETFSDETKARDNGDGGPPIGGQFLLAMSPEIIAIDDWQSHCDLFFERMSGLPGEGVRLPGERRHKNRRSTVARQINSELLEKIRAL